LAVVEGLGALLASVLFTYWIFVSPPRGPGGERHGSPRDFRILVALAQFRRSVLPNPGNRLALLASLHFCASLK